MGDSFSPNFHIILYHPQSFFTQLTLPPHVVCILFVFVVWLWIWFFLAVERNCFLHTDNFMFCFHDVSKDFKMRLIPKAHFAILEFSMLSHTVLVV